MRVIGTKVKALRILVTILVILVVWILCAWGAAQALIIRKELVRADVILVLAGSSTYHERVQHAAELVKEGRSQRVLLTNDNHRGGWSEEQQTNPFFAALASEELQVEGIKPEQIEIISPATSGTYGEAIALREYAQRKKLMSLIIVTSPYHSRRAFWTFNRVFAGTNLELGMDAVAPGQQTPKAFSWWLHRRGWEAVPVEYVKLLYYLVKF